MAFHRKISEQHYADGPCWDQSKLAVSGRVFDIVASSITVYITRPLHVLLSEEPNSSRANFHGELRPVPISFRQLLVRRSALFSINDDVAMGRNYVVCSVLVEDQISLDVSNCAARELSVPARYLTNALGVGTVLLLRNHKDLMQYVPIPFRRLLVRQMR